MAVPSGKRPPTGEWVELPDRCRFRRRPAPEPAERLEPAQPRHGEGPHAGRKADPLLRNPDALQDEILAEKARCR